MSKIKSIYSLRELHDLLKTHVNPDKLILFLDLDLTIIMADPSSSNSDKDVLIEPEETKKLFDFLHKNKIWYTFVTARFHNIVTSERKRKEALKEMRENIEMLYPIFEQVGINCDEFKNNKNEELQVLRNEKNKPIGIMYKGILLGDKKGEIIKHFRLNHGLDKTHPHVIFVDDIDKYLRNVKKHIPTAFVYKRQILEEE